MKIFAKMLLLSCLGSFLLSMYHYDTKPSAFLQNRADVQAFEGRDTTGISAFYQKLRSALKRRDPNALKPLLASTLVCDFAKGNIPCEMWDGCARDKVIADYFADAKGEGWSHFSLFLRQQNGFKEMTDGDRTFHIAPYFPDTIEIKGKLFAYVFADQVLVRNAASKSGKAVGKLSRCFVQVDRDELCYGSTDEAWLPILDASGKRKYIFMEFTNWSENHGYIQIARNKKGNWQVVNLTWGRKPLGIWYLLGCC